MKYLVKKIKKNKKVTFDMKNKLKKKKTKEKEPTNVTLNKGRVDG